MSKKSALGSNPFWVQKLLRKRAEKVGSELLQWSTGFVTISSSTNPNFRKVCIHDSICQRFEPKVQHWQLSDTDLTPLAPAY